MSAFDDVAGEYDATFSDTEIGRQQRQLVHAYLTQNFSAQDSPRVLELNCGTGVDAQWLLEKGFDVTATDQAKEMVEIAAARNQKHVVAGKARFFPLDMAKIDPSELDGPYDLIFSDFGGLNCLSPEQLQHFLDQLPSVLKPGGHFVAVVMPRFCWWESGYFMLKGKGRDMMRRRSRKAVEVELGDSSLNIWYYNPSDFARKIPADFVEQKRMPVGFFIPPSYLQPRFREGSRSLKRLTRWERRMSGVSKLASWSDHYLWHAQYQPR